MHSAFVNHVLHFVLYAVGVLIAARIVPGIRVRNFTSAFFFAIAFAVLDYLLFGVFVFLSLPVVILTFGLFIPVIHAVLFLVTDRFVDGVEVDGLGAALFGSIISWAVSVGLQHVLGIA